MHPCPIFYPLFLSYSLPHTTHPYRTYSPSLPLLPRSDPFLDVSKPFQELEEDAAQLQFKWDGEDLHRAEELSIRMASLGHKCRNDAFRSARISDLIIRNNTRAESNMKSMVSQVMKFEGAVTNAAIGQQRVYALNFKTNAARMLLDVVLKVQDEYHLKYTQAEARKYFRWVLNRCGSSL